MIFVAKLVDKFFSLMEPSISFHTGFAVLTTMVKSFLSSVL
jgi:hypothetical protein